MLANRGLRASLMILLLNLKLRRLFGASFLVMGTHVHVAHVHVTHVRVSLHVGVRVVRIRCACVGVSRSRDHVRVASGI